MKTRLRAVVRMLFCLSVWAFVPYVPAQTDAASTKHLLETQLNGKQLGIRDFIGDATIPYGWKSTHFEHQPSVFFTLGLFKVDSIRVHESSGFTDSVTLQGQRRTLLKNNATGKIGLSTESTPVSFIIDCRGATTEGIATLGEALFFADLNSTISALPAELADTLPYGVGEEKKASNSGKKGTWIQENGAWHKVPPDEATPPKVLFTPELKFGEAATRQKFSAVVKVLLIVDSTGKVGAAWLLSPVGSGLDENALLAAKDYRFQATKHAGNPVGSLVNVNINFQTS